MREAHGGDPREGQAADTAAAHFIVWCKEAALAPSPHPRDSPDKLGRSSRAPAPNVRGAHMPREFSASQQQNSLIRNAASRAYIAGVRRHGEKGVAALAASLGSPRRETVKRGANHVAPRIPIGSEPGCHVAQGGSVGDGARNRRDGGGKGTGDENLARRDGCCRYRPGPCRVDVGTRDSRADRNGPGGLFPVAFRSAQGRARGADADVLPRRQKRPRRIISRRISQRPRASPRSRCRRSKSDRNGTIAEANAGEPGAGASPFRRVASYLSTPPMQTYLTSTYSSMPYSSASATRQMRPMSRE